MVLDLRKAYQDGLAANVFKPFDTPLPRDADFEIQFCKDILRRSANHVEALALLGDAYTRKGQYQKGLELDLRLSRLRPDSKHVQYNLACSYALTGQTEEAFAALELAVELGFDDVEHLRDDQDLEPLRSDPRYAPLLERVTNGTQQPQTKDS
jgi:tetratricopeptide (TPR) repeat protein